MATGLRNVFSRWWGRADNSPGLPTHVSSATSQPVGAPVVVVVTTPPSTASQDLAAASVVIELGAAALHQPPPPAPKLKGRAAVGSVLPTYHNGEAPVLGSSPTGSPATHRAHRPSDAQRTPKEPSEQECLAKLQQLEGDPPSGFRDAEKAYYTIMLAKKTADLTQAKSRLLQAREHLDSAEKLTRDNTLCPQQVRNSWSHKIEETKTLLGLVAAALSISLDPEPSPVLPSPAPSPDSPSSAPEKPSSSSSSITYIVIGIIALLGAVLVGRLAVRQFRNIIKL